MKISEITALIINCSPVRNGAATEIVRIVSEQLSKKYATQSICIDDYSFGFCKDCRNCQSTAECIRYNSFSEMIDEFEKN